jgi:hypothetical protein
MLIQLENFETIAQGPRLESAWLRGAKVKKIPTVVPILSSRLQSLFCLIIGWHAAMCTVYVCSGLLPI